MVHDLGLVRSGTDPVGAGPRHPAGDGVRLLYFERRRLTCEAAGGDLAGHRVLFDRELTERHARQRQGQ